MNARQTAQFVANVLKYKIAGIRTPTVVSFLATYRCPHKCSMCGTTAVQTEELPTDATLRIIDGFAAAGMVKMIFTGGEVFVREDFDQLVERCAHHGVSVSVNSSGVAHPRARIDPEVHRLVPPQPGRPRGDQRRGPLQRVLPGRRRRRGVLQVPEDARRPDVHDQPPERRAPAGGGRVRPRARGARLVPHRGRLSSPLHRGQSAPVGKGPAQAGDRRDRRLAGGEPVHRQLPAVARPVPQGPLCARHPLPRGAPVHSHEPGRHAEGMRMGRLDAERPQREGLLPPPRRCGKSPRCSATCACASRASNSTWPWST